MRRWADGLAAIMAGAAILASVSSAGAAPRRVVSLNPCLDAILLEVADPAQITALSRYSRDPRLSAVANVARRFPSTGGSAEEVVALKPDLVLTSGMGALELTDTLPRLGVRQESFNVPASVDESLGQVDKIARLVGHAERGALLNARIRAAIIAAGPRPGEPRLGALIFEFQGLASGPRTLVDELMRRTGFDNLAARYGLAQTGNVPLEPLLADPPQVLLAGRMASGEPMWVDHELSHPALKALQAKVRVETFPEVLMWCGGPTMIAEAAALARAREDALRGGSQ